MNKYRLRSLKHKVKWMKCCISEPPSRYIMSITSYWYLILYNRLNNLTLFFRVIVHWNIHFSGTQDRPNSRHIYHANYYIAKTILTVIQEINQNNSYSNLHFSLVKSMTEIQCYHHVTHNRRVIYCVYDT